MLSSFKFCGNIEFCPTLDNNFVLLLLIFAADFHPLPSSDVLGLSLQHDGRRFHDSWLSRWATDGLNELMLHSCNWYRLTNCIWISSTRCHPSALPARSSTSISLFLDILAFPHNSQNVMYLQTCIKWCFSWGCNQDPMPRIKSSLTCLGLFIFLD